MLAVDWSRNPGRRRSSTHSLGAASLPHAAVGGIGPGLLPLVSAVHVVGFSSDKVGQRPRVSAADSDADSDAALSRGYTTVVVSSRPRRLLCGSPELVRSFPVPLSPDAHSYFAHQAADFREYLSGLVTTGLLAGVDVLISMDIFLREINLPIVCRPMHAGTICDHRSFQLQTQKQPSHRVVTRVSYT